jgi:hypothetical protein
MTVAVALESGVGPVWFVVLYCGLRTVDYAADYPTGLP